MAAISAHGPRTGTIVAYARRWLADPRVAVLITNRPGDAVAMRG
jgi:hypothetical protein